MSETEEVFITAVKMEPYNITNNMTYNITDMSGDFRADYPESYKLVADILTKICLPLFTIVGLLGNTMSMLVFSTRHMRSSSCSVFLAALALVDNVFLLSLVINWVDGNFYNILTTESACMTLVFTTYVASFLSVWFIVGFTCERYFAICFPLRSNFLCSVFKEKVTVFLMSLIAIVLYNFSFWTTDVHVWDGIYRCYPKQDFLGFLNIATWVDTFLTMVIPFFLISTMNTKVLCTIIRNFPIIKPNSRQSTYNENKLKHMRSSVRGRRCPTLRVTRTVLLVSTTFLFLNLPSHIIRLYTLIISFSSSNTGGRFSWKYIFLQEIAQLLYYSTFSCNFILYTLFGRNFKHSLVMMLKCRSQVEMHRERVLIRLSSTKALSNGTSL